MNLKFHRVNFLKTLKLFITCKLISVSVFFNWQSCIRVTQQRKYRGLCNRGVYQRCVSPPLQNLVNVTRSFLRLWSWMTPCEKFLYCYGKALWHKFVNNKGASIVYLRKRQIWRCSFLCYVTLMFGIIQ